VATLLLHLGIIAVLLHCYFAYCQQTFIIFGTYALYVPNILAVSLAINKVTAIRINSTLFWTTRHIAVSQWFATWQLCSHTLAVDIQSGPKNWATLLRNLPS